MLLSTMLYCSIGSIIIVGILHALFFTVKTCTNINKQFLQQQAQLLINHYFKIDIHNAGFYAAQLQRAVNWPRISICNPQYNNCIFVVVPSILQSIDNHAIHPHADILILHNIAKNIVCPSTTLQICAYDLTTVAYYLKKSVFQPTAQPTYSLYRDDALRQAVALVDNISNMQIVIENLGTTQLAHITITFLTGVTKKFSFSTRNGN
jgi:hypothetical protein